MPGDPSFSHQARLQGLTHLAASLLKPASSAPEWPSNHTGTGIERARTGQKAKIVIIASEFLIRDCLARCLQSSNAYTVEPFGTVPEWIDARLTLPPPALILLCAFERSHGGAEVERDLAALSESGNAAPLAILSDVDDVGRMQAAFELGARGYISTKLPLDVALSALRVVEVGGTFVPASSLFDLRSQTVVAAPKLESNTAALTARQVAVGDAIRRGKSNKQIAYELDMRESTVKVHIRNIMKRLKAKNRTEVAVRLQEFLTNLKKSASK